ncbi:hypothetical protein OROMI_010706 [Orobanche minor]
MRRITSKRPRVETSRPSGSSGLVCCVHGDPCRRGCDNDAWADKIVERLSNDTSERGPLARMAKFMAGHLKGLFQKSGSSSSHRGRSQGRAHSFASECGPYGDKHHQRTPQ